MFTYIKNISFYSLGQVLNKSIQFILLPVYAHYLTPADYGLLELTYLYGAVLIIFYGFIVENGYVRLYFDKQDTLYRDTLFGTAFFFKLLTGIIFLLLSFIFSSAIASLMFETAEGTSFLKLISISILLKTVAEVPLKTLIVEKRAVRYVLNNLIYLVVSLLSTIYFIVCLDLKVKGVLYGQILGASVQLITLLYTEWKKTYVSFSFSLLKGALYFSVFLIPSNLASFISYWSNRLFLLKYATLEDVGTFSFGYKIASIIPILLTQPIKKALGPEIYELIGQPDKCRHRIRRFTLLIFIFLSLFVLSISVLARELISIIAPVSYISSHEVVFVLSMGYLFIGIAGIVVTPIHIRKKTWLITIAWVSSAAVNLLLNLLLVPRFGKLGATYATMATMAFILLLYFIFAELIYQVKFEYVRYAQILALVAAIHYAAVRINSGSVYGDLFLKTIVLVCTTFLFFRLFIPEVDRERLLGFLKSRILRR